jgi:hypothetical protein
LRLVPDKASMGTTLPASAASTSWSGERDAIADAQLVEQHVDRLGGHDAAEQ